MRPEDVALLLVGFSVGVEIFGLILWLGLIRILKDLKSSAIDEIAEKGRK